MSSDDANEVQIGEVIDGKFRVDRIIGTGAIGLVIEAMHLELSERVALKFLRASERTRKGQVARFAHEARAAVRLKGEHVARVYDVGSLPSGTPYIVTEYLEGRDLEHHIAESGKVQNLTTVALYMIQACEALAEAHSLGIIHRGIKPANLFLHTRAGALPMIKLLDFGISKAALTGESTSIALADATTTTTEPPFYLAPEQVRGAKDVDRRADIWSLGAVMFELVTGQPMWHSNELGALVQEILHGEPLNVRELRPDVPEDLAAALECALQRAPDARYSTAAEFARTLLRFAPPTAQVHVERAERFAQSSERALPSLRTAAPKDLTSSTSGAILTPELEETDDDVPSRVVTIAVGVFTLAAFGLGTTLLAPRFFRAPAAVEPAVEAPQVAAPSITDTKPSAAPQIVPTAVAAESVPSPSPTAPTAPTPSAATTTLAPTTPFVGWRPAAKPTTTAATKPEASAPPPAPTDPPANSSKPKQTLDDNPWQQTGKPKLDDLPSK